MAAPFIKGVGAIAAQTITLTDNLLFPFFPFNFEYARETAKVEAKGQVFGTLQTLASAPGEVTDTLTLSTQYLDWATLGFFLNEREVAETAPVIPVLKSAQIPATGALEINDSAIDATTTYVAVADATDGIQVRTMVSGSPTEGTVKRASGKLTFHASDTGKLAYYQVNQSHQDTKSYGGTNVNKLGTFQLIGKTYPDENIIIFPSVDFTGTPTITASGTDASTLELSLTPNTPTSLGYTVPYKIYKRPAVATPSPSPSPTP